MKHVVIVWEMKPCAVFTDDGTLSFIRPTADSFYTSGSTGTVKSISGGEYTGKIFTISDTSSMTWSSVASQVKKVVFVDKIKPVSTAYWFRNFTQCIDFDVKNLDTSDFSSSAYLPAVLMIQILKPTQLQLLV